MHSRKPLVFLVAGGTAGHINGALSLGEVLNDNGYRCQYISSKRSIDYRVLKDLGKTSWHLNSQALKGKGVVETIKNIFLNKMVFLQVLCKTIINRPHFAIGFGGFICGPTLLACKALGIPYYIVEQNSVMGMANKLLVPFSKKIFTHFEKTINLPSKHLNKVVVSGNPIRSSIQYYDPRKIDPSKNEEVNILVFGGSLGAEEINKSLKSFIDQHDENAINISIKHQVGQHKEIQIFKSEHIKYEQLDYIDDMNEAYKWADGIICRGGASTISELTIIKKPCLIFPYPHLDQHQLFNAKMLKEKSLFSVCYIEKTDKPEDKVTKLNSFLKLVFCEIEPGQAEQTRRISERVSDINSAQTIFEHIQRDLV